MVRNRLQFFLIVLLLAGWSISSPTAFGIEPTGDLHGPPLVRIDLRTDRPIVLVGREIWVELSITNLTGEEITLRVPEASSDEATTGPVGLPLNHVFSGIGFTAVTIENNYGDRLDRNTTQRPRGPVPQLHLAPYGSVGTCIELTRYYDILSHPGHYTLTWRPYHGTIGASKPLSIQILPEQQAVILTEFGNIILRFYYDQAPHHVANFVELVQKKFYDNLKINRMIPGGLIQGGDPRGDRKGIRPDGKRLKAEFSDIPFELGTVGMARAKNDPDSASCQFYICLGRQPAFDRQQTAFAYVVGEDSLKTLQKIAEVPTDGNDSPQKPVYIRAISLEDVPMQVGQALGSASQRPAGRPTTRPVSAIRQRSQKPATQPANVSGQ